VSEDGGGRIDPKDVAAGTAVGAAQRYGTGAFRKKRDVAAGAGAGAGRSARSRGSAGGRVLTAVVFSALLVAMLVLMVRLG
jgi:hypothetical protein